MAKFRKNKFRRKMSRRGSKKLFTKTARGSHPRNNNSTLPRRGGTRL